MYAFYVLLVSGYALQITKRDEEREFPPPPEKSSWKVATLNREVDMAGKY